MGTGVDMDTKKLYLESIEAAYEDEFSAKVLAIEENKLFLIRHYFTHLEEVKIGILERLRAQMVRWMLSKFEVEIQFITQSRIFLKSM